MARASRSATATATLRARTFSVTCQLPPPVAFNVTSLPGAPLLRISSALVRSSPDRSISETTSASAAAWVARAPADGHTIFFSANSTHAANIHLFRKLPYDPVKDFQPLSMVARLDGHPVRELAVGAIRGVGPANEETPRLKLATLDGRRVA
mgnify:CR=1 FL=1